MSNSDNDNSKSNLQLDTDAVTNSVKSIMKTLMGSINSNTFFKKVDDNSNDDTNDTSVNDTSVNEVNEVNEMVVQPVQPDQSGSNETIETNETNETNGMNEKVDSFMNMFKKMMDDMNKYANKPYLSTALMSKNFEALSMLADASPNTNTNLDTDQEYLDTRKIVGENSKKVCEMLKNNTLEELCLSPEFKEYLLPITINYNKMLAFTLKVALEKLEERRTQLTNDLSTEELLDEMYKGLSKKN